MFYSEYFGIHLPITIQAYSVSIDVDIQMDNGPTGGRSVAEMQTDPQLKQNIKQQQQQ